MLHDPFHPWFEQFYIHCMPITFRWVNRNAINPRAFTFLTKSRLLLTADKRFDYLRRPRGVSQTTIH